MLKIDGSYGEGGGQLLRLAVALSAITGTNSHIIHIRACRDKPGLAPQHLTAVQAVAKLCDASIEGLALRSQEIIFRPGSLRGGDYRFDIGTAGSIALLLQALLPVMLATKVTCKVYVNGGTDVRLAPPADYLVEVLLRLIIQLGAHVTMRVLRRGYYPRGGGTIEVTVQPSSLAPIAFDAAGHMQAIRGIAHVTHLPDHIALRMKQAAHAQLVKYGTQASIETLIFGHETAYGSGGAIVCWAEKERTTLGAGRVAERGIRAETLGEAVGGELAMDLAANSALDVHAADQILIYLALAKGGSFTTRHISLHARTAMWLIEQFLPVTFAIAESAEQAHVTVAPLRKLP